MTDENKEISSEQLKAAIDLVSAWCVSKLNKGEAFPCPCCTSEMKIYTRKFNSGMARALIAMHHLTKLHGDDYGWLHIGEKTVGKAICLTLHHWEYEKLPNWGLIEKREDRNDFKGVKGGFWRITPYGRFFLVGQTRIPSHAVMFMSDCMRLVDDKDIGIVEALGKHFNCHELMNDSTFILKGHVAKREQQTPSVENR